MKKFVKIILLFFWLVSIVAPSISSILESDKDLVANTMSEEEQKEQEKKNPTEEKIVCENFTDFSLIAFLQVIGKRDFQTADYNDYTSEIVLPPPKHLT